MLTRKDPTDKRSYKERKQKSIKVFERRDPIDFYGFDRLYDKNFLAKALSRWENILHTNAFIDGDYNCSFEKNFARLQGAKHCLLVGNGTDALEIALQVCGVGPGDRVGVPGITFYASAEAVINIGGVPVFIDIDPQTGLICPDSLARTSQKYSLKAVLPVHIYGLPAPMEEIEKICLPLGIQIVEDAAQAQGAFYTDNSPIGSRKNMATFSFYPTKNLGAAGDAGCILTQDSAWADKIVALRNHGRGIEGGIGRNSRCDHLQAAFLDLRLADIEKLNVRRKAIAILYHQYLGKLPIKLLPEKYFPLSSWHLYPIQVQDSSCANKLGLFLKERGIDSRNFYQKSLSQELWGHGHEGETSYANSMAGRVICLPNHPLLTDGEIFRISQEVAHFFEDKLS